MTDSTLYWQIEPRHLDLFQWRRFGNETYEYVYVLLGAQEVLYIGRSHDPRGRLRTHKRKREWWPQVRRVDVLRCANLPESRRTEKHLIRKHRPRHNRILYGAEY